jgi:hypothetical protein
LVDLIARVERGGVGGGVVKKGLHERERKERKPNTVGKPRI